MKTVIEMAIESGLVDDEYILNVHADYKQLERFAALVRAEREWVDLTDEEIEEAVNSSEGDDLMKDIRAVIAKFKEKQL